MPSNFLITGAPKSGKTMLIGEIIDELRRRGFKVGGFISPSEKHHGTRTAFHVVDVESGREALLASVDGDGPKVSKYHVDVDSFESIAIPCMENCGKYDVFVLDEIGRMEMKSKRFSALLEKLLQSDKPLIASLHRDYVDKFGLYGELFTLSGDNRERVYADIFRKLERKPSSKAKKPPAARKREPLRPKRKKKPLRPKKEAAKRKAAKKKAVRKPAKAKKKIAARKRPPKAKKKAAKPKRRMAAAKKPAKARKVAVKRKASRKKGKKRRSPINHLKRLIGV